MTTPEPLYLEAIKARRQAIFDFKGSTDDLAVKVAESAADIPALVAEVERLRATTPEWEYAKGAHFVPPSLGDPGFFACEAFCEVCRPAPETKDQ